MHIPDGWIISGGTAVGSGVLSLSAISASLVTAKRRLQERQLPLMGLVAACLLVVQAIHIPIVPLVPVHLIGGALAAILLGPWLGLLVMAAVVLVETLGLGYGGVTTLGANIVLSGLVPVTGGYLLFRGLVAVLPRTRKAFLAASAVTAWVTVVATGAVLGVMLTYGTQLGVSPKPPSIMVLVAGFSLVGIGEAVITALAVKAIMDARPDLMATHRLLPPAGATLSRT